MLKTTKNNKSRVSDRQVIWILAASLVGFLLTLYTFYPGYMSSDSVYQLAQGRMGVFNDWNPPVMSWFWGQIDHVVHGPFGMLTLFNLLFWSGLAMWMVLVIPGWSMPVKALITLAIGFSPPIVMLLGTIWKDVGMMASLLFASSWLVYSDQKSSKGALFVSFTGMWIALALRHNAIFAVFPLMIYSAIIINRKIKMPFNWFKYQQFVVSGVLGLVLLVVLLFTTMLAGRYLTRSSTTYSHQQIFVHDLVAISLHANEILLPDLLIKPQQATLVDLRKIYATEFPIVCLYSGCDVSELRINTYTRPDHNRTMLQVWIKAILAHPDVYLTHRLRQFARQFGFIGRTVCYPYITENDQNALTHFGIDQKSLGASRETPEITRVLNVTVEKVKNSLLFRGWVYLAFLTLLIIYILFTRKRRSKIPNVVIAVAASGWLYGLAYIPLSTTCDFRMHYWTVVAAIICAAAMFGHSRR